MTRAYDGLFLSIALHLAAAVGIWSLWQPPARLPRDALPIDITVEQRRPPAPDLPASDSAERPPDASPAAVTAPDPPSESQAAASPSLEQLVPPPPDEAPVPPALLPPPAPAPAPSPPKPQARRPPSPVASGGAPHAVPHSRDPSPSPFLAAEQPRNRARVADNYLWQIARKLAGYRFKAGDERIGSGITVVRLVIARDGRLLDAEIAQSSGHPKLDAGVLAGAWAGSPYAALPPELPGSSVDFTVPVASFSGDR